jgi:hypothetical protein
VNKVAILLAPFVLLIFDHFHTKTHFRLNLLPLACKISNVEKDKHADPAQ